MIISFIAFALNPYPHSVFKASENRCYSEDLVIQAQELDLATVTHACERLFSGKCWA
jgi:hypothetical protein